MGKLNRYMQNNKLDHQLTTYTRIISKWIKDLNVICETIKILERKIVKSQISYCDIFADISPKARETKEKKISKWDYVK